MAATTLKKWIDDRQSGGRYTFLRREAVQESGLSAEAVKKALQRMTARGRPLQYLRSFRESDLRGMNRIIDWVDWVGGYPFEVCSPTELARFASGHGFAVEIRTDVGGRWGCNEYLLRRRSRHG